VKKLNAPWTFTFDNSTPTNINILETKIFLSVESFLHVWLRNKVFLMMDNHILYILMSVSCQIRKNAWQVGKLLILIQETDRQQINISKNKRFKVKQKKLQSKARKYYFQRKSI